MLVALVALVAGRIVLLAGVGIGFVPVAGRAVEAPLEAPLPLGGVLFLPF
jgi:hypothetical protein